MLAYHIAGNMAAILEVHDNMAHTFIQVNSLHEIIRIAYS